MNFLRTPATAYVKSARTLKVFSRSISTTLQTRQDSPGPATKFSSAYLRLPADPLTPSAKDDAEEYTSSWDLTAPGVVSTDVSPVKSDKVSAEILNRTPREQRREDLKKITSVKKLNRMLGSLPQAIEKLDDKDLHERFIKGWGNGGQAINKTNSAVCLTHKPSGLRVKVQPTRSLQDNRIAARKTLAEQLANLDPHSTRQSRSDLIAAKNRLKKDRARRKSAKKYGNTKGNEIAGRLDAPVPLPSSSPLAEEVLEETLVKGSGAGEDEHALAMMAGAGSRKTMKEKERTTSERAKELELAAGDRAVQNALRKQRVEEEKLKREQEKREKEKKKWRKKKKGN